MRYRTSLDIRQIANIATYLVGDTQTEAEYSASDRYQQALTTLRHAYRETVEDDSSLYAEVLLSGCAPVDLSPLGLATELWDLGFSLDGDVLVCGYA